MWRSGNSPPTAFATAELPTSQSNPTTRFPPPSPKRERGGFVWSLIFEFGIGAPHARRHLSLWEREPVRAMSRQCFIQINQTLAASPLNLPGPGCDQEQASSRGGKSFRGQTFMKSIRPDK